MFETRSGKGSEDWRRFIKDHWRLFMLFVVGVVLAFVGAVLVFLWFIGNAQSTGMIPLTLGLWTMGNIVNFLINLAFWEILLIGIPIIVAVIAVWQWWKRLLDERKQEYHMFGPRSKSSSGGNAFSFLVFIAFCIKIYVDGNWNAAISTWSFDYFAYSMISALIWVLIIFGIPAAIALVLWMRYGMKTKS
ncbi:MAG TPA: hypothetical protein VGK23_12995 [Methanomassiliicoccales archaeon]|jgi:hypothetical protein